MDKFPLSDEEVLSFADGCEEIAMDHYEDLYAYYTHPARGSDQMPYGTAKARSGDPDQWIADQLEDRARSIRGTHAAH